MHAVDWVEIFRPAKLVIFTRLGQTEAYGSILSLAAGQRIPEDLEAGQPGAQCRPLA
jgi:hypothetical protein